MLTRNSRRCFERLVSRSKSRPVSNEMKRNISRWLVLLLASFPLSAEGTLAARTNRELRTVVFRSKLVRATLPYIVILPAGYGAVANRKNRYPVVYLLHGFGGHYSSWLPANDSLSTLATQHQIIIVAPEGNNGWYTDSATIPTDKYETYLLREVMPDVQRRFRTIRARSGRGIAGFSMGGYGALKFGLKHPGQFILAASLAGPMTTASWTENMLTEMKKVGSSIRAAFGPEGSPTREANDLFKLVRKVPANDTAPQPYLYIACGDKDSIIDGNREIARLLSDRQILHEFHEVSGGHDLSLYNDHLAAIIRLTARIARDRTTKNARILFTTGRKENAARSRRKSTLRFSTSGDE